MKYTKIKSGFSENRRIPRLGRIRLGLKMQKQRTDGSTVEFPTETDYFVCPQEVQDVYGPKPTELDIMLPSDRNEDVFPQSLAWFGRSKGLKCKGDMETAERLNEQTGIWEPRTCPCEHYKSDQNPKGECTENGILISILPRVNMGGTYQLRTGSYHSTVDINSGLDYVRALVGRISMVPLKLKRVARETHNNGTRQIHHTLSLTIESNIEGINQLRGDTSRILSHAQLQIEGPLEENPVLDPPDVTEIDAMPPTDSDEAELATVHAKLAVRRTPTPQEAPAASSTVAVPVITKPVLDTLIAQAAGNYQTHGTGDALYQSSAPTSVPTCPTCGKSESVIKSKAEYGGGWCCYKKKNGCGAKWWEATTAPVPATPFFTAFQDVMDWLLACGSIAEVNDTIERAAKQNWLPEQEHLIDTTAQAARERLR